MNAAWFQRLSQTAPMIKAIEREPGSTWPSARSPRNDARPLIASIAAVACGAVERALAHARDHVVAAGGEQLLHRVEHVEQRLLADLGLAQAGQRLDAGVAARAPGRPACGAAGNSLASVTISVPNTGPDEPPIVDMQVMPIVLAARR